MDSLKSLEPYVPYAQKVYELAKPPTVNITPEMKEEHQKFLDTLHKKDAASTPSLSSNKTRSRRPSEYNVGVSASAAAALQASSSVAPVQSDGGQIGFEQLTDKQRECLESIIPPPFWWLHPIYNPSVPLEGMPDEQNNAMFAPSCSCAESKNNDNKVIQAELATLAASQQQLITLYEHELQKWNQFGHDVSQIVSSLSTQQTQSSHP